MASASVERDTARSTATLDHPTLLRCAAQLISEEEGLFLRGAARGCRRTPDSHWYRAADRLDASALPR